MHSQAVCTMFASMFQCCLWMAFIFYTYIRSHAPQSAKCLGSGAKKHFTVATVHVEVVPFLHKTDQTIRWSGTSHRHFTRSQTVKQDTFTIHTHISNTFIYIYFMSCVQMLKRKIILSASLVQHTHRHTQVRCTVSRMFLGAWAQFAGLQSQNVRYKVQITPTSIRRQTEPKVGWAVRQQTVEYELTAHIISMELGWCPCALCSHSLYISLSLSLSCAAIMAIVSAGVSHQMR